MNNRLQELMHRRVKLLRTGRFEELAEHFALPLVMFKSGCPVVVPDKDCLIRVYARIVASQIARGVVRLEAEVIDLEITQRGRFRFLCTYREIGGEGVVLSQFDVLQYCVESPSGIRVEMTESNDCWITDGCETAVLQTAGAYH